MTYESVDALQRTLADSVFTYCTDRKKAAGRALGTLVELVTFYTLTAWKLRDYVVIERSIPEFANPGISHNVEFSLHPVLARFQASIDPLRLPLTGAKLRSHVPLLQNLQLSGSAQVLSSNGIKRNACVLANGPERIIVANVDELNAAGCVVTVCELLPHPFAIFECKRVGIEEGMTKGPQTIEKAKQGAYVARTVSALQKVRRRSGEVHGVFEDSSGQIESGRYDDMLRSIVDSRSASDLKGFILTVGVVSNHGNWFTSQNQNKEMRVLSQSYDWLLFLTDTGLAQFVTELLLDPEPELEAAKNAFLASYSGASGSNRFTKVKIDLEADEALRSYFCQRETEVESWFNVISPHGGTLDELRYDLSALAAKEWLEVADE